jgi:MFS transporter, ACS family, DAL5 transporter family protein
MGYTAAMAQILSIPIFMAATVSSLIVALATDRLRHRFAFIIIGVIVGVIGYIIMLCMDAVTVHVRYMACFFIVAGGYIAQPVTIVWLSNQVRPSASPKYLSHILITHRWEVTISAPWLQQCRSESATAEV